MRILVIHCAYQYMGGEDVTVNKEIELLRSKGDVVELLLFSNDSMPLFNLLQLPFNIKSYIVTENKISQFKPDIVHIHNLHFSGSTSVLYAVKKRAAVVYTLHNYRLICPSGTLFNKGKIYLQSLKTTFPLNAVFKKVYRGSLLLTMWLAAVIWLNHKLGVWKLVNRFIVLTNFSKELVEQSRLPANDTQLVIKPNFTEYNETLNVVKNNEFLYVGRLSDEKGINILIEAFLGTTFTLNIIGDGPYRDQVIETANNNVNINYLGFQDKAFISNAMQHCTALIFPSIWYETFGLTIIEAFAVSTPVIAANIGAASSLIQHGINGLHFKPGSAESLNNILKQWNTYSESTKNTFRQNALHIYKEYYTPDNNYKQLIAIYKDAMLENKMS